MQIKHNDFKTTADVTGVILAGGRSTRMGRDKATLEVDGTTLFERTRRMLSGVFAKILISGDRPDLATDVMPCVPDIYPGSALGGLHAALSAAQTPWIFVVPCDLAFPDAAPVRFLLACRNGCDLVVPRSKKGLEPVFALYHKNCLPLMEEMLSRGDCRIYDFYQQVQACYVDVEDLPESWQKSLINLNTPDDVRRVIKEKP